MKKQKSTDVIPAYKNEPGKPIVRSGCPQCGLLGSHTRTCPMGLNPVSRRTPFDPI